jgi:hypothetical protein
MKYLVLLGFIAVQPLIASAQTFNPAYPLSVTTGIMTVLEFLFPLLLALAVLYFIWGVVVFIAQAGDEKARTEGKQRMVWGIGGLFIIVSVWGLVALLQSIFAFGGDAPTATAPQATFGGAGTGGGGGGPGTPPPPGECFDPIFGGGVPCEG